MVLISEKITDYNVIDQEETDKLSSLLMFNISVTDKDDEASVAQKIDYLKSLRDYLNNSIDIDSLTDSQQLIYMHILSKIGRQIENFEIAIGRKDIEALRRAAKRFSLKTKDPVGFVID